MRTIYYNGQVYTGDNGIKEAFLVEENIFIHVGTNEEILHLKHDKKIDLQGKFICSGFNDSHMHLLNYGYSLRSAKLNEHTSSIQDVIDCMISFMKKYSLKEGNWICGRGFNHDYFEEARMPNRFDLDQISTLHPVCITRACGHNLVVNTKVLELLNIDPEHCDNQDIAMGIFYDDTMSLVFNIMRQPDKEEIKDMLIQASASLNQYGITSCHSDDYGTFSDVSWKTVDEAYQELMDDNKLTVRVYQQANFSTLKELQEYIQDGNTTQKGNAFYKVGPVKIVADGSLGTRTAYLTQPYHDDPTTKGLLCYELDELHNIIQYAHEHNMQLAIHTIGDACLDIILNEVETALKNVNRENHRHGIVHCQITRADQLEKIKELNLIVYAQSIFLDYDIQIVRDRVGEMANTSYNWKTLLDGGVNVSNGSDCPVEMPFALGGIQCAITRQNLNQTSEVYLPNQSFTLDEALKSYTISSAYASFEENIKGYIKENYLADFIVLDKNPFTIQTNQIKNIQVLETYVNGKCVYRK